MKISCLDACRSHRLHYLLFVQTSDVEIVAVFDEVCCGYDPHPHPRPPREFHAHEIALAVFP